MGYWRWLPSIPDNHGALVCAHAPQTLPRLPGLRAEGSVVSGVRLQVLVLQGARQLTHFGRHQRKLDMVTGTVKAIVSSETAKSYAGVRSCPTR